MPQSVASPDVTGNATPTLATPAGDTYEQLPYENRPLPATRPDVLATLATLGGLTPAQIPTARVLEIGCAVGGNLLPMAQSHPEGRFVGIDLSAKQIAMAQRTATGAGLANIRFEVKDLASITPDFGEFDYIIAHGVYSAVAPPVRERLLRVLGENLSHNGLAYLSYNVYPGWHTREMFRDMLVEHVRGITDVKAAVAAARQHIALLQRYVASNGQAAYAAHLSQEAAFLASAPDDYLAHDYLEAGGDAVYFQDFARQLDAAALEYIGEVRANPVRRKLADALRAEQPELARDWAKLEQMLDSIHGSFLRRSLLCRAGRKVERNLDPARIEELKIRTLVLPAVQEGDIRTNSPIPFRTPEGSVVDLSDPLMKAVLIGLGRAWPRALRLEELLPSVRSDLRVGEEFAAPGTYERQALMGTVMACYAASFVDLHVVAPQYTLTLSEKPKATPLARYQARESTSATNTLHFLAQNLTKIQRLILAHLNGARDRVALVAVLRSAISKGILPDPAWAAGAEAGFYGSLEQTVERSLQRLATDAFLIE